VEIFFDMREENIHGITVIDDNGAEQDINMELLRAAIKTTYTNSLFRSSDSRYKDCVMLYRNGTIVLETNNFTYLSEDELEDKCVKVCEFFPRGCLWNDIKDEWEKFYREDGEQIIRDFRAREIRKTFEQHIGYFSNER